MVYQKDWIIEIFEGGAWQISWKRGDWWHIPRRGHGCLRNVPRGGKHKKKTPPPIWTKKLLTWRTKIAKRFPHHHTVKRAPPPKEKIRKTFKSPPPPPPIAKTYFLCSRGSNRLLLPSPLGGGEYFFWGWFFKRNHNSTLKFKNNFLSTEFYQTKNYKKILILKFLI